MKKAISCGVGVVGLLALGAVAFAQISSPVQAVRKRTSRPVLVCGGEPVVTGAGDDNCFSTCGGEIPWPFQSSNQVVELADGELYVLMGRVQFVGAEPRFEVDLTEHPWLASARRRSNPTYALAGTGHYWKRYAGRRIQLRARPRWLVSHDTGEVEISLESLADPAVVMERTRGGAGHFDFKR